MKIRTANQVISAIYGAFDVTRTQDRAMAVKSDMEELKAVYEANKRELTFSGARREAEITYLNSVEIVSESAKKANEED